MKKLFKNNVRLFWINLLENRIQTIPKHWQEYSVLKGLISKLRRAPVWEHAPDYYVIELDDLEVREVFSIANEALGAPEGDGAPEDFVETKDSVLQEGIDFHSGEVDIN